MFCYSYIVYIIIPTSSFTTTTTTTTTTCPFALHLENVCGHVYE